MSDREPYDRDSWYILVHSNNRDSMESTLKNRIEKEYYSYYEKISRIHLRGESDLRTLKRVINKEYSMRANAKSERAIEGLDSIIKNRIDKIAEIKKQLTQCELLLSSLEATTPIQNILQRERKPREIITLSYLNIELPEIPYNVIVSKPRYITKEEIKLINDMDFIDIAPSNKKKTTISTQKFIPKPILLKIKEILPFALAIGIPILLIVLLSLYYN